MLCKNWALCLHCLLECFQFKIYNLLSSCLLWNDDEPIGITRDRKYWLKYHFFRGSRSCGPPFPPKKVLFLWPQQRVPHALSQRQSSQPCWEPSHHPLPLERWPQQPIWPGMESCSFWVRKRPFGNYFPVIIPKPHAGWYFPANPRPGTFLTPDNVSLLTDTVAGEQTLGGQQNPWLPEHPWSWIHWSLNI